MAEDIPTWLNNEFLAAALQGGEEKEPKVNIIKFNVDSAIQPGENKFSYLYRVRIEYTQGGADELHKNSVIIKTPSFESIFHEFLQDRQILDLELCIYRNILPKMYSLKTDYEQITPLTFYSMNDELLILEDLKEKGYVMMDRLKQLDFSHSVEAVRTLAKFHAMSIAVKERHPGVIETINKATAYTNSPTDKERYNPQLTAILNNFANAIETWEGYSHFGSKVRKLIDCAWEMIMEVYAARKGFNVLNHGDSWCNNYLFRHDNSGNVTDCKLIDFQVCIYGTPAIDLQFFTWTSVQEEVRKNRLDEIYSSYLDTLNSTLELYGVTEKLLKDQLYHELKITEIYGFVVFCTYMPFVLSDPENLANITKCTGENLKSEDVNVNPVIKNYYGKYFKGSACNVLLEFEEKGLFN